MQHQKLHLQCLVSLQIAFNLLMLYQIHHLHCPAIYTSFTSKTQFPELLYNSSLFPSHPPKKLHKSYSKDFGYFRFLIQMCLPSHYRMCSKAYGFCQIALHSLQPSASSQKLLGDCSLHLHMLFSVSTNASSSPVEMFLH